jgi:hypothetical protein
LQVRLTRVFEVLAEHYGAPDHLVQLQILLDLSHNPKTSAETRRAVAAHGEKLTRAWVPLFEGALGDAARDTDLVRYAFLTLRGYLQGGIISAHIADMTDDTVPRRLLIEGVAAAIEAEARSQGIEIK